MTMRCRYVIVLILAAFLFSWTPSAVAQVCSAQINISPSSPIPYGTPVTVLAKFVGTPADTITGSVTLNGSYLCGNSESCSNTISNPSPGTNTIAWKCTASGLGGGGTNSGSQTFTVNQPGIPTVSAWPTASAITWGQSLASSALSGGTASVAGTFAWTAPSTVPPTGSQSESVTFTPSSTDYSTVTGSTNVPVNALTLSSPTINTGVQVITGGGPSLVPFANGLYTNALQLIYVDKNQDVEMAYSTDGLHYTNVGTLPVPYGNGVAELDCSPDWSDHCGVAAVEYNNELYVAYNDISCNCLYVLAGTPNANSASFTWTLAYTAQPAYWLVTTPAMLMVPNEQNAQFNNLIIRYGTTEGDNEAYSSVLNGETGTWSTQDSNSTSPTQSTLFTIDGVNYAIDLSNGGTGVINITELDDNGVAIPGTAYELQGGDSGNVTQGFSSTVYSTYGHCVFVPSMPPAGNQLQMLSTSDYYNFADGEFWGSQPYSNIQVVPSVGSYPGDFAIALFQSAIVVAYSGDSSGDLYATSGTPAPCN